MGNDGIIRSRWGFMVGSQEHHGGIHGAKSAPRWTEEGLHGNQMEPNRSPNGGPKWAKVEAQDVKTLTKGTFESRQKGRCFLHNT